MVHFQCPGIFDGGVALSASALGSIIFQNTWRINNYFIALNYNSCMPTRALVIIFLFLKG